MRFKVIKLIPTTDQANVQTEELASFSNFIDAVDWAKLKQGSYGQRVTLLIVDGTVTHVYSGQK